MRVSILERLLVSDRIPRRSSIVQGDFSRPFVHERQAEADSEPVFVTTSRGAFVQTRKRPDGTLWAGFSELPVTQEHVLVPRLYSTLWETSKSNGWRNRAASLEFAYQLLIQAGYEPKSIVVPFGLLKEICPEPLSTEEVDKLMLVQGFVAKLSNPNAYVYAADLPEGAALVTAAPAKLGTYTRSFDHLALMLFRVNRAVVLVGPV